MGVGMRTFMMCCMCGLGYISFAFAQQVPSFGRGEVGWVGLFDGELIGWLENENRLTHLCSNTAMNVPKWNECRDDKMKPKRHIIQVRGAPDETATLAGEIIVQATPGQGLRAFIGLRVVEEKMSL